MAQMPLRKGMLMPKNHELPFGPAYVKAQGQAASTPSRFFGFTFTY